MNTIQNGSQSTRYRLPISKILIGAVAVSWLNRRNLLRGLGPTAVALITVNLVWQTTGTRLGSPATTFFLVLSMLLYTKFAVICHRLVLVEFNTGSKLILPFSWSDRETRFFGWMILVYVLVTIASTIISMAPLALLAQSLPEAERNNPVALFPFAILLAGIPATYLLARMSLMFPATAIDARPGLAWAWNMSRGNGVRIAVIIGLIPWASGILDYLFKKLVPGLPAAIVASIISYIFITIEITALSLSYREISEHANNDTRKID